MSRLMPFSVTDIYSNSNGKPNGKYHARIMSKMLARFSSNFGIVVTKPWQRVALKTSFRETVDTLEGAGISVNEATKAGVMPTFPLMKSRHSFLSGAGRNDRAKLLYSSEPSDFAQGGLIKVPLHDLSSSTRPLHERHLPAESRIDRLRTVPLSILFGCLSQPQTSTDA